MDLRITPQALVSQTVASLQQNENVLANLQEQASTGLRILQPSDDPVAAVQALATNAQNLQLGSYLNNITTSQATLNASSSALQQAGTLLTQATSLATQGANGSNGSTALSTLATQVNAILGQVVSLANTQDPSGRYVFGGTATRTAPYVVTGTDAQGQPTGVQYVGSNEDAETAISPQQSVGTAQRGTAVFGGGTGAVPDSDVFQTLIALHDALNNTAGLSSADQQAAISGQLTDLQRVQGGIQQAAGEQGAALQTLSSVQSSIQGVQLNLQSTLSNLQGADVSQVAIGLQAQQNQLQLTLASASRIFSQSLLDFLQ